jgi:hypothetical protein
VRALGGTITTAAGTILLAVLLAVVDTQGSRVAAADAPAAARRRTIAGTVMEMSGRPVDGLMVFAADARTDAVTAMAASDADGKVQLVVPQGRYNFGVLSPLFGVDRLVPAGTGRFELVVARLPPNVVDDAATEPAARVDAPRASSCGAAWWTRPASGSMASGGTSALKKYWYVDVLRREAPTPASISTVNCTPASAYQPGAFPTTTLGSFDIWTDAVPPRLLPAGRQRQRPGAARRALTRAAGNRERCGSVDREAVEATCSTDPSDGSFVAGRGRVR